MALNILTASTQAVAVNYSYTTSGSTDWSGVTNSSYFYDLVSKLPYFKNNVGDIYHIFTGTTTGLQADIIYVDSVYGTNTSSSGDLNKPYLTVEYALSSTTNTGLFTGGTTNNSTTISGISDTQNAVLKVGQYVTGSGIPFGTIIVAKGNQGLNLNTITLSQNATATASNVSLTWWTIKRVKLIGSFTINSNIAKSGYWIDSTDAIINFGGFQLFSYTGSSIPESIILSRTFGTNVNSCLINTTSTLPYLYLNYGNYYSSGTLIQLGSIANQLAVTNFYCEGNYFDARFGTIAYLNIGTSGYIKGDFYGLLGGFSGPTANTMFVGRITTPTSVGACSFSYIDGIITGNVSVSDGAIVYGKITCTTFTISAGSSPYYTVIYADIIGNVVSGNGCKIYGKIVGNFTNSGPATISDANLYGGIGGTITATSGTITLFGTGIGSNVSAYNSIAFVINAGTIINKADINVSTITYTGAGKFINTKSGTVNIGSALNVGSPIVLSQGTFINEGFMNWTGEQAAFINKTGGNLFSNGKWYNPYGMYVSYSTNTSPAKDVIIGYSMVYGNLYSGTDKSAGTIRRLNITAANLATSVTINDGSNIASINVSAGTKTQSQIITELISGITATTLVYQSLSSFGTQLIYVGGSNATVTFTTLTNCTDNGTYNGGGGFNPNVLGGGIEIKSLNFNL